MPELNKDQLVRWQAVLEAQTGINLKQHEHILVKGLGPWLQDLGEAEAELTLARSESQPWRGLGAWLVDHLAVKETRFYRNPAAYRVLAQYLSRRLKTGEGRLTLDLWSAGCSSGEEAYTMAMIASEMIEHAERRAYFGVIGSDISSAAVKAARQGVFHVRRLQSLPDTLRQRYLLGDGLAYRIEPKLASRVCFVQSNLLDAGCTPTSAMDVIFCQNVLVYFRGWRQKQVLNNLVKRLKPGGILVIGASEGRGWRHPDLTRLPGESVQGFERRQDGREAAAPANETRAQ